MKNYTYIKKSENEQPYNFYAERMVLASILFEEKAIYLISQKLSIESFYFKEHKNLYRGCLELASQEKLVDPTTLITWLNDHNLLKETNGIDLVAELMQEIVVISNLENYISLVQEKYLRRLLIDLGYKIINSGYLANVSIEKIFEELEEKIYSLTGKKKDEALIPMTELLSSTIVELKEKSTNPSLIGLSSSYVQLDSLLHGFQNSDLIIIAGRPSMGKTSFALNIASNISKNYNLPILIFSLEMSKQQLIYRFLSMESGIESNLLRSGRLSSQDWKNINKAVLTLSKLKIFFDDTPSISIARIRFKLKKFLLQEKKLGLIIIDYLQLIQDSSKNINRAQELSQITRGLKGIAREFNIPVIVLSQLSRNVEARTNKRPILSDLRESGCIEALSFINSFKRSNLPRYGWNGKSFIKVQPKNLRSSGIKPIYELHTSLGFILSTTANHKFYGKKGWVCLKDIQPNSLIGIKIYDCNIKQNSTNLIVWDKVLKIKYKGVKEVYDLIIPETSNYLIDRILTHNSIEQDADVVIMIYRENLYNSNQQTLNYNEVEFIVAKHRNGPTGNFKLAFDSRLTKFSTN